MSSSTEAMDTSGGSPPAAAANLSESTSLSALRAEFETRDETVKQKIMLKESRTEDDGKCVLIFTIEGIQNFTLYCPSHYPEYNCSEDNFFVEADLNLRLWCNALNEYLLDTAGRLTLTSILSKGLSLYSSADAAAAANSSSNLQSSSILASAPSTSAATGFNPGCPSSSRWRRRDKLDEFDEMEDEEDEDEDGHDFEDEEEETAHVEDDEQLEDILDNDLSWELEIARRKKRWRTKEAQLRAERSRGAEMKGNNGTCDVTDGESSQQSTSSNCRGAGIAIASADEDKTLQQLYHDPSMKSRQPKQVFTSAAASGILTNDLVCIMETTEVTGIEADTIDDNIFQWNVRVKNFAANCPLDKDFQELKSKFGYDYVELQLDFSMDLYPFFPPLVKVIRPRLQGSMMLRVTTMEILKLSYWNPARDMKSVLVDIKAFLQTWARLDMHSERNDRGRYPDGAYIDIEHHLLRLALVSEIVPRANKKYVTPPPLPAPLPLTAMEPTASSAAEAEKKKQDDTTKKVTQKSKFAIFTLSGNKEKEKEEKKKALTAVKNMAKGVGYSNYQQKGWDVKAYMAAQKEKDKQIELVLAKILQELKKLHGSNQQGSRNLPDLIDGTTGAAGVSGNGDLPLVDIESRLGGAAAAAANHRNSRRKRKHSPDESTASDASAPIDPLSDLYAVLEGSALVPFLESRLRADSFLEICSHTSVYKCVVNIIREIASQPYLVSLLGPLPDQNHSLNSLLLSLETQARVLLDKIGKASANGSVPKSGKPNEKVTEKTSDDKLARDFLSLSKEVTQALKHTGFLPDINGETSTWGPTANHTNHQNDHAPSTSSGNTRSDQSGSPTPDDLSPQAGTSDSQVETKKRTREDKAADLYRKHMKGLQMESCTFSTVGNQAHAFSATFQKAGSPNSTIIFRIAQELSSLTTSLPLDFSSSIFLRSDDDKATLLRAVITGPEETPYTGGCYQFDIYFPPKYPQSPPQVNFRTTGGGIVRFNPNLYQCGKVCLSLLGTWEGAQGEQWNETSTLLQVLISIQSLILCSEPYYNEPGYERMYGTPQGESESLKYSEEVFKNNLKYAIIGQLQNPPEGFEQVVKAHFFLKRHILIKELEQLLEKYKSKETKKQFAEVKRELMKLEQPPGLKESYKSTTSS